MKYQDILPEYQSESKLSNHDKAEWSKVNLGDTVEVPNTFSYRNIFMRRIKNKAQERATELGCALLIRSEYHVVYFKFAVPVASAAPCSAVPILRP